MTERYTLVALAFVAVLASNHPTEAAPPVISNDIAQNESIQQFLDRTSEIHACEDQGGGGGVLTCPGGWKLWQQKRDSDFPAGVCMSYAFATLLLNTCGESPDPEKISYALYGPDNPKGSPWKLEDHFHWWSSRMAACSGLRFDTDFLDRAAVLDPENDPNSMLRKMLYPRTGQSLSVEGNPVAVTLVHPKTESGHMTVVVNQSPQMVEHITWQYFYRTPAWAFYELVKGGSPGGLAIYIEEPSAPRPIPCSSIPDRQERDRCITLKLFADDGHNVGLFGDPSVTPLTPEDVRLHRLLEGHANGLAY